MKRLTFTVEGRVQGVGFRNFTQQKGRGLRLTGWVRNREDGSVEGVAEGSETALNEFLAHLRRGPAGSRVDRLDTQWSEPTTEFTRFDITY